MGLGVFGLVLGVGMFPAYPLLAYLLLSRRCYRLALTDAAPGSDNTLVRCVLTWTLPQYSLDSAVTISRSFAHVVGRCRRPSPLWAGIATFQPIAMLFCVFAQSGYCAWMFSITGLVFIGAGLGTIGLRPHRIPFVNVISCVSLCLTGVVVGLSARLATTPLDANASSAVGALAMVQTAVTCVRVGHLLFSFTAVRFRGSKWLKRVSPEGDSTANPQPVFEITCCATRRTIQKEEDLDAFPMLQMPQATQPSLTPAPRRISAPPPLPSPPAPPASGLNSDAPPPPTPTVKRITRKFAYESRIFDDLLDNHRRGYVPMELPYEVEHYSSSDEEPPTAGSVSDDLDLELEISPPTQHHHRHEYNSTPSTTPRPNTSPEASSSEPPDVVNNPLGDWDL